MNNAGLSLPETNLSILVMSCGLWKQKYRSSRNSVQHQCKKKKDNDVSVFSPVHQLESRMGRRRSSRFRWGRGPCPRPTSGAMASSDDPSLELSTPPNSICAPRNGGKTQAGREEPMSAPKNRALFSSTTYMVSLSLWRHVVCSSAPEILYSYLGL